MNTKYILFILLITLCVAQALAACGTAAPVAPVSEPTIAPRPAVPATSEPVDAATVARSFYEAANAGDIEAAMALVAENVKCRGACYITGKESFRSYIQGSINMGGRVELSDLQVDGEKVSYNWKAYNTDDIPVALGMETLQIENGLIVLMETQTGTVSAAPAANASDPVTVVRQFYELLNAKDVAKAMELTADDYVMNDPFGTYDRAGAAVQWQSVVDAGLSFNQTDFLDTGNGRVTSCYEVFENGKSIDKGCGNVTHVRDGKIIYDGLETAEQIWVVQKYYEALNARQLDLAMSFIASDALFINPTGTYEGADAIRESLAGLNTDGITFDLSNFRNTAGKIVYDYKVMQGSNLLDQGTNGLTVVKDGMIVFDGTEDTLVSQ